MCDNEAEGIWAESGGGVEIRELPVSLRLRQRIMDWQGWYERLPIGDPWRHQDALAFDREGLAIAREVKRELPSWKVVWWVEHGLPELPPQEPGYFCYEIASDGSATPGAPRFRFNPHTGAPWEGP